MQEERLRKSLKSATQKLFELKKSRLLAAYDSESSRRLHSEEDVATNVDAYDSQQIWGGVRKREGGGEDYMSDHFLSLARMSAPTKRPSKRPKKQQQNLGLKRYVCFTFVFCM